MANVKTIEDFQKETKRLFEILENNINNDYYGRNIYGEVLYFTKRNRVTFDSPLGDATPFIEMKNGQFNFVISERGKEYERIIGDSDKILFSLFEAITFDLACSFELNNRINNQDSRRIIFLKQIELLNLLNSEWALSENENHQKF